MPPENQPNQPSQPNPTPQDFPQDASQPSFQQQPVTQSGYGPAPYGQPVQPEAVTPATQPQPMSVTPSQPFGPSSNMASQQPQQPMNPMAPGASPSGPMMGQPPVQPNPSSDPLGGLDKKLLIWIGAGVGALVVIAIAVVLIASSFAVSKEDYKTAYDYATDARSSYTDMSGLSYVSTYSTETEMENNLDSFKKSREEFDQSITDLGSAKAVQRDGKAKELYDALMSKKKSFDEAMGATVETYEHILPAMSDFNAASSSDAAKLAAIASAAGSKFEASEGELKNEVNKKFAGKMSTLFKRYAALLKKVAVYRDDYTKYDSRVASDYSSTAREISTAIRDWSSDLRKVADDAEISDEFNELGKYLAEKTSV